jgi:probable HAF family extracellular repeat protein
MLQLPAMLAAQPSYRVIDLGSLGGDYSVGLAINSNGQVTGYSTTTAGHTHAFLYSNGVMTDLGTLGGTESYGRSINEVGQIVGDSLLSGSSITATDFSRAFSYNGSSLIDLGTLGADRSSAYGINASGQITGWSSISGDVFPNWSTRPFLYSGDSMHSLPSVIGVGRAINANGQVAGGAYLWTPNTPNGITGFSTSLGSLGGATEAVAINSLGQVVGVATTGTGSYHAFLYSGGAINDLGGPVSSDISAGMGINDLGQIVATSDVAMLYGAGQWTNLNSLIDAGSGWELTRATGINNNGWITGKGTIGGAEHGYLLIPVPEPSVFLLFAMGCITLRQLVWRN